MIETKWLMFFFAMQIPDIMASFILTKSSNYNLCESDSFKYTTEVKSSMMMDREV